MNLTVDEQHILAIFHHGSRMSTITALQEMRGDLEPDETELVKLTDSVLEKLRSITDEEYLELDLDPIFE